MPMIATSFGTQASAMRMPPQAYPIRLLAAPVAAERPTFELELIMAKPPRHAEIIVLTEKVRMAELPDFTLARFQSASLIFSAIVRSPADFSAALSPNTANGRIKVGSKAMPGGLMDGNPSIGASATRFHCSGVMIPAAADMA